MNMNSRNVTYSTIGDYQLPNLTLPQQEKALGKYGRLRRTYLMKHRPVLYNSMLLSGTLHPYLLEVEQTAENQMQQTMEQLLKQNPAPDKEQNQMAWVQHMNSLKAQAEELVLNELIYS
ncbi:TnpV protein [uncultured Faecalibacterium sp.]|uniref:TnpV protein n=1 Tax=uncultured Faecalibacterium sp. TaxID=259315 RepID=UPI0026304F71|nr:TnpV protein [uncultured Faecalibacterium sp.]